MVNFDAKGAPIIFAKSNSKKEDKYSDDPKACEIAMIIVYWTGFLY